MPRWEIRVPKARYAEVSVDPRFRDLLLLARAANAVRFAVTAGTELLEQDGAAAFRQQIASYFFVSAGLEEAFVVVQRLGRTLHGAASWRRLSELRKAEATADLRARVLDPVRNTTSQTERRWPSPSKGSAGSRRGRAQSLG